ncbi:MAG: hypothetical protein ACXVJN_03160 [Mucilaginibacter sp.]
MKRKPLLYTISLFLCLAATYACKKTAVGFLSPYIHYEESPILIPKGRAFLSAGLNGDGTSQPFSVKVVHYYDKATGKVLDTLFNKSFPVQIWTALYDSKKDTTLQLINAKLKTVNATPISINTASGQIVANYGALKLPAGEYQFDLQITNETGTRVYPKIGDFILKDTTTYDAVPALGTQYNKLFKVGNEGVSKLAKTPILTITRVADTPNIVTVQFLDKNGAYFDPKKGEIQRRPNTGLNPNPAYLQTLQDYSIAYSTTDNAMVFKFPFTPFPLNSLGNGYNIYYRIPTNNAHIDGQPDGTWSLNPRFPIRIYVPGSYLITMQFPDVTRVP